MSREIETKSPPSWTGAMLPYYRDRGETCRVTGIDPDPNMLDRAQAKSDELGIAVDLVSGRAESLPFEDGRFDVVVASLVLCSVDDLDMALAEIERVLVPDGEFRFSEHVRSHGLRG
jgi:ubiquinone/menaquinone biosynthesis C-methylase UbiE